MKLSNIAKSFDKTLLADAFNPTSTFLGKVTPFEDVLRDSLTGERRILSVAPDVAPPDSRVVMVDGTPWIIGAPQVDLYSGQPLRKKYVMQQADELTALKTFSDVIAGAAGTPVYSARSWVKTVKETDISSLELGVYDLFFSPSQAVAEGSLIQLGGTYHLIRSVYPSPAGFRCALADQLEEPVVTSVTFTTRVHNPLTDDFTETPTTVNAVKLHWQSYFRYPTQASYKFERGDDVLVLRKSDATPKAGDKVALLGFTWNIIAVLDEVAHWSCHVRRA